MIYGIGTDILKISTIEKVVSDMSDPFILKTYTSAEIQLINSRPIPLYSYATRFAGKEAVFKSLRISGDNIYLNQIEILEDSFGIPTVTLSENVEKIAISKGVTNIMISLSYDTDYAIAYATALVN